MNTKHFFRQSLRISALTLLTSSLVGCFDGGDDNNDTPPVITPVAVGDTIALTASNRLVSFNRTAPGTLVGAIAVTGLASGEGLLGIDIRPADQQLYALGSLGNVYVIAPDTGVATLKSTLKPIAGDDNPFTALAGTDFGVDFNPVADRLRVVSSANQNLRINVDTGETTTDGVISAAGATASVTAAAYTNSFAGTTTTQLYDIDGVTGLLHLQNPPNDGVLAPGLPLGVAPGPVNGFDVDAFNNVGYAAFGSGSASSLYTVNLLTGAATSVGAIGAGETLLGLALVNKARPVAWGLTDDNRLVGFAPGAPNTLTATLAITGLDTGASVVGVDYRPVDGLLYALTGTGKLYTVDTTSGAATLKASLAADVADTTLPFAALSGSVFSVDFNPLADRLRVVSETGQNLRINVDTGATTTDGDINRATAPATVFASAYTKSYVGTPATALYNLESNNDVLTQQNPPNDGVLIDIGALGLDLAAGTGFDIAGGDSGLPLVALRSATGTPSLLYTVSLTTGAATPYANTSGNPALSQIGGASGPALRDLAIRFQAP